MPIAQNQPTPYPTKQSDDPSQELYFSNYYSPQ
jgi:hypothetical protein